MDQEQTMGKAIFKCPTNGELVPMGLVMDRSAFEAMESTSTTFGCVACGKAHTVEKGDLIFQEDG